VMKLLLNTKVALAPAATVSLTVVILPATALLVTAVVGDVIWVTVPALFP